MHCGEETRGEKRLGNNVKRKKKRYKSTEPLGKEHEGKKHILKTAVAETRFEKAQRQSVHFQ